MPNSNLEQLWDGVQKCGNLKHINLKCSKHLTKIPDLSLASKLEFIDLRFCCNLKTLPKSLPFNIWKLKALEEIDLSGCLKLRNLPEIENQSEHLWKLNLECTSIQKLPSSIENLIQL
ncbi:hypothetical protein UlMin_041918 [Ulmus minor]